MKFTIYKVTTNATPFQLVYGPEAILPIELGVSSLRIAVDTTLRDVDSIQFRLSQLEKLDEIRTHALLNIEAIQN